ncbi:hypothetical protein MKW92_018847 [Papaver armeniacum]|nr:hypothetical protein MKW92_018847 [Papaver armeniacum]
MNQRAFRLRMDYLEICEKGGGGLEDYQYSDAHRNHMLAILKDPTGFTDEEKIDTLLSFHKDTCANLLSGLYSSADVESQDLEILKVSTTYSFFLPKSKSIYAQIILKDINNKNQLILQEAILEDLRAKKQLFQMKTVMSFFLKSRHSPLLEDKEFKKWMLENSQFEDDDVDYHDDDERLEAVDKEISSVLGNLQMLGADTSKYQDGYLNFQISDPEATISKYKLLDNKVKNTSEKVFRLLEYGHPHFVLLIDLERQVQTLEMESAEEPQTVEKKRPYPDPKRKKAGSRSKKGKGRTGKQQQRCI